MVRYRCDKIYGLESKTLRDIQASYTETKLVWKRIENILKVNQHFDSGTVSSFLHAKTLEEVEFLYAPFKSGLHNLAERPRELGLEPIALDIFHCKTSVSETNFSTYVNPFSKGLQTASDVQRGIQYIISDEISKNEEVLDFVRNICHEQIRVISSKASSADKVIEKGLNEGKDVKHKYEKFFNFNLSIKYIEPHQVMAIRRGEKKGFLTVKIQVAAEVKKEVKNFIWTSLFTNIMDKKSKMFLRFSINDSYHRLIEPHLCQQVRSKLEKNAENECIEVFCSNLQTLLLSPPVRGKTVIAIDPGFTYGCKLAAVSSKGAVLKTDIIYPFCKKRSHSSTEYDLKLRNMVFHTKAEIFAIGNGKASRETELWLSKLIASNFFHPLELKYCFVNESGVSIHSVTDEAKAELPNLGPLLRSAVFLARRLQDPLLEYVKIDPKHLGVGMYQHDVSEDQLKKASDSVIEECVSFVGVDLNVCSESVLKKISGLNDKTARSIIHYRNKNGPFINRQQLLEVKGLDSKTFQQAAGFLKILPQTSLTKPGVMPNPLDRTIVHPESYEIAEKFLKLIKASLEEIGKQSLIEKVNSFMSLKYFGFVALQFLMYLLLEVASVPLQASTPWSSVKPTTEELNGRSLQLSHQLGMSY